MPITHGFYKSCKNIKASAISEKTLACTYQTQEFRSK